MKMPVLKQSREETRTAESCNTCRYYQEYEDLEPDDVDDPDDLTGVCRRYPPVVFPGITPISVYPDVAGLTGWCGEFTPK